MKQILYVIPILVLGFNDYSCAQDVLGRKYHDTLSHNVRIAQSGWFHEAIANLRNVKTLRSYNLQATWLHAVGETRKAIPLLEESYRHFPNDKATLRNLVVLHFFLNNHDECRKYASKLFSITPQTGESFEVQRIAIVLENDVDEDDRSDQLLALHQAFPNKIWTLDRLAALSVRRHDLQRLFDVLAKQSDLRARLGIVDGTLVTQKADSESKLDARKLIEKSGLEHVLPSKLVFKDFDPNSHFITWLANRIGGHFGCEPIKIERGVAVGQSAAHSYTSSKRGTVIVLSPELLVKKDDNLIHDAFWFALVFEILNRHSADEFSDLNSQAKQGLISELSYVRGVCKIEHNNLLLATLVYHRLVRSSLGPSKSSDPLLWRISTPSSFDTYFKSL